MIKDIPEVSNINDPKVMNESDEEKRHADKNYIKTLQNNPLSLAQKLNGKVYLNMNIQTEEEKGFLSTKNNIASIIDSKNNNGIRVRSEKKKIVSQRINAHNHKYFSMLKRQNIKVKYKNKITDENKIADKTKKNANSNNKKIEHKGGVKIMSKQKKEIDIICYLHLTKKTTFSKIIKF